MKAVLGHLRAHEAADLDTLAVLVAQPSISAQNVGVAECARLVQQVMLQSGITAEILPTAGQPVVYGEVPGPQGAPTILFYGHYDVQPPEPLAAWRSPPFQPTLRDGRMYGRGTGDNKAQFLTHILAVRSFLATVGLPLSVKFLIEGEEESSSANLEPFVRANRDRLACDLVYIADGPLDPTDAPVVAFGVRGNLTMEFTAQGADRDNHSGNKGGVVPNPAWTLVHFLHSLRDLPGFRDRIRRIPADEELIRRLPLDPAAAARSMGLTKLEMSAEEFYRRSMLEPTMNIAGFTSGYGGRGSKTIIPAQAVVKMDCRLVADQDPDEIFALVRRHAAAFDPAIQVRKLGGVPPSRTDPSLPISRTVIEAVGRAYGQAPLVRPCLGATDPEYCFTQILGRPCITVPYANADEDNHAPNENMRLDLFYAGIRCSAHVIAAIGTR